MKILMTAVSFAALMAVPVLAQDTTPTEMKNAPPTATERNDTAAVPKGKMTTGQISASELLDETVVSQANESVGDINDIILDSNGKVASVIVGVGGFLGIGEKDVALSFDQLAFANNDNDLVVTTNATKESLQAAPEYVKPDKRT